jgi:hypothetical protein
MVPRAAACTTGPHPAGRPGHQRDGQVAAGAPPPPRRRAGLLCLLWAGRNAARWAGPGGRDPLGGGGGLRAGQERSWPGPLRGLQLPGWYRHITRPCWPMRSWSPAPRPPVPSAQRGTPQPERRARPAAADGARGPPATSVPFRNPAWPNRSGGTPCRKAGPTRPQHEVCLAIEGPSPNTSDIDIEEVRTDAAVRGHCDLLLIGHNEVGPGDHVTPANRLLKGERKAARHIGEVSVPPVKLPLASWFSVT